MQVDVVPMFERMAESGTAPSVGCRLFGVGFDDAFERIRRKYLDERFSRGDSAEKFVVGPYGSGKTHFLRHLAELARESGCVTAEVALNKEVDFTQNLVVYKEVSRQVTGSEQRGRGMPELLLASIDRIQRQAPNEAAGHLLVTRWINGLESADFELSTFGRVAKRGIAARLHGDQETFEAATRWLEGDVTDKLLARCLDVSPVTKVEENIYGRRMLLSLFQLIRRAGFRGTVLAYDEAEQGLSVDRRRMQRILSMLQSNINAIADLRGGSALIVFALTPDLIEQMEHFAALQQRVADPGKGLGFFDGNTLAPRIDLSPREDPERELARIGASLVRVFFDHADGVVAADRQLLEAEVSRLAQEVAFEEGTSGNRRTMVKRTCAMLVRWRDSKTVDTSALPDSFVESEI